MTLKASGILAATAKIQYIRELLRGKALHQLDTFFVELVSMTTTHLNRDILVLRTHFFHINVL